MKLRGSLNVEHVIQLNPQFLWKINCARNLLGGLTMHAEEKE